MIHVSSLCDCIGWSDGNYQTLPVQEAPTVPDLVALPVLRERPQVLLELPHRLPVCHALQVAMHLALDPLAARCVHLEGTHLALDQQAAPYALRGLSRVLLELPPRLCVCLALQVAMHLALDHLVAHYVHLEATHLALDQQAARYALRGLPRVP
jgi:hypothetical protein